MSFLTTLRNNPTKKELKIKNKLEENNLKFIFQQPMRIDNKQIIVDFFFPNKKIVIEIDGNAHISILKDIYRDYHLIQQGYLVLRYNNDQKTKDIVNDILKHIHSKSVRNKTIDQLNRFFKFTFGRYYYQTNTKLIKIDLIIKKEKYEPLTRWLTGYRKRSKRRDVQYRFTIYKDIDGNKIKYLECRNKTKRISRPFDLGSGVKRDKFIRRLIRMGMTQVILSKIFNIKKLQMYRIKNDISQSKKKPKQEACPFIL